MKSRFLKLAAGCMAMAPAWASYDANIGGVVTQLLVYTDSNVILFSLDHQPTHPTCNAAFFALDSTLPEPLLSRLYARLLSAKATGEVITIGYDSAGNCAHLYIRAHRVG